MEVSPQFSDSRIDHLWNKVVSEQHLTISQRPDGGPEYVFPRGLKVKSCDSSGKIRFLPVRILSRHLYGGDSVVIRFFCGPLASDLRILRTTDDHTCFKCEFPSSDIKDYRQCSAHEIREGDFMLSNAGCPMTVKSVDIIPYKKTSGPYPYYYDMEIEDGNHSYFANGILVHNSQFIDISPITKNACRKEGIPDSALFHELPKNVVNDIDKTTDELLARINKNVAECVNRDCHTTQGVKLHYAKEYLSAEGFYFAKKHYIVHKVFDDGKPCDKFKYSGISVKKAEIPACMKMFLKDIYESTMAKDWNEADYVKHVKKAYDTFCSLDWEDVSYYKKYQTEKTSTGLCSSEKGAGVHARGANFYNNLIDKMGISGKYEKIHIGEEMRYCYVTPDNVYGMDVIAFKGKFPQEFRDIFHIDYGTMFQKIFTKSLETFVEIMQYAEFDPNKQIVFDVFN